MSYKIKKTVIFLGYSCNNNCLFCCNSKKRNQKESDSETIKRRIYHERKLGSTYLEFVGGEPTIRKDIFDLVKFAKKIGYETIMLATNGRMFSSIEFAKKIIETGLNHIVFSIHGHVPELHDSLTQTPESFNQLVKGINNLKKIGFSNIGSNTTIVKQNYKFLRDIAELLERLGIINSEFIFVDPTNGFDKFLFERVVPTYEETAGDINKLLEFAKKRHIRNLHIRYYPLCFIDEKFHESVSELKEIKNFHTRHFAPDFINLNSEYGRKINSRKKADFCVACKFEDDCEGFWKEYLKYRDIGSFRSKACYILLTTNCNLNCSYCYIRTKKQDMDIETLKKSIDLSFQLGRPKSEIVLFGGEPLLKKELIVKAIEYIKLKNDASKKNINISCVTNGTLIDDDYLKIFKDNNVKVSISIDGIKSSHLKNRVSSSSSDYENTIRGFKRFSDTIDMEVITTIAPNCVSQMSANVKYLHNLGCRKIRLRPAAGLKWSKDAVESYGEELKKISDYYIKQKESRPFNFFLFEYFCDYNKIIPCSKGTNLTILPDGSIIPCFGFMMRPEETSTHIIGSVNSKMDFSKRRSYINRVVFGLDKISLHHFGGLLDSCFRDCLFNNEPSNFSEEEIKNLLLREIKEREISKDCFNRIPRYFVLK